MYRYGIPICLLIIWITFIYKLDSQPVPSLYTPQIDTAVLRLSEDSWLFGASPRAQFSIYRNGLRQKIGQDYKILREGSMVTLIFLPAAQPNMLDLVVVDVW
jgi:hypothetical protein